MAQANIQSEKPFHSRPYVRNLEFDPSAFEDLAWWIEKDRKKTKKIVKVIEEVQRYPFTGIGLPGKLKHELAGAWPRRIDQEHRLVYDVHDDKKNHSLQVPLLKCCYNILPKLLIH